MKRKAAPTWTTDGLLELGRSYQVAALYAAAVELKVFDPLAGAAMTAERLAPLLNCDLGALQILLDALAAVQLLHKQGDRYTLPAKAAAFLTADGANTILAIAQRQAHALRCWAQLARVIKSGRPAKPLPGVRWSSGDLAPFFRALHNIHSPVADSVIRAVRPLRFKHLLDLGGMAGTWIVAFLRACPAATATLLESPRVIPIARRQFQAAELSDRVELVASSRRDPLPRGADLVWVNSVVSGNSRSQNRALFAEIFVALAPGGRVAIRDVFLDATRTRPVAGALFAVTMLLDPLSGGSFTVDEIREDLTAAGFIQPSVRRRTEPMERILVARKPRRKSPQPAMPDHETSWGPEHGFSTGHSGFAPTQPPGPG